MGILKKYNTELIFEILPLLPVELLVCSEAECSTGS
jgi:hypothetical protein